MLYEIRIGLELIVSERKVVVLVVPSLAVSVGHLDVILRGSALISFESITFFSRICKNFRTETETIYVEPPLGLAEKLRAAFVDDCLEIELRCARYAGPVADEIEGLES